MELTPKDRLFLFNQYRILEKLYPDEAADYRKRQKAVSRGYPFFYGDDVIDPQLPLTNEECNEVGEIMDMYTLMQRVVDDAGDNAGIDPEEVRFHGFSGNDEKQCGYAEHLVEDQGRFAHLRLGRDGLNSHIPMMDRYRAELRVWRRIRDERGLGADFTLDDVRAILDARNGA